MKKILILLLVTLFSTQVIGAEAHDASSAVNNKSVCLTGGHAQVDGVPSLHDYENLGEAVAAMNRSDAIKYLGVLYLMGCLILIICKLYLDDSEGRWSVLLLEGIGFILLMGSGLALLMILTNYPSYHCDINSKFDPLFVFAIGAVVLSFAGIYVVGSVLFIINLILLPFKGPAVSFIKNAWEIIKELSYCFSRLANSIGSFIVSKILSKIIKGKEDDNNDEDKKKRASIKEWPMLKAVSTWVKNTNNTKRLLATISWITYLFLVYYSVNYKSMGNWVWLYALGIVLSISLTIDIMQKDKKREECHVYGVTYGISIVVFLVMLIMQICHHDVLEAHQIKNNIVHIIITALHLIMSYTLFIESRHAPNKD